MKNYGIHDGKYITKFVETNSAPPEGAVELPPGLDVGPLMSGMRLRYPELSWERPVPVLAPADQWEQARMERNRRLAASDWAVLPDVPMTVERRQQWEAYRQALRDITDQADPATIVWPVPPT